MRFGSRSHDPVDSEKIEANVGKERARLVAMLRDVADRIEQAPTDRAGQILPWVRAAVEPLLAMLRRVLGPDK